MSRPSTVLAFAASMTITAIMTVTSYIGIYLLTHPEKETQKGEEKVQAQEILAKAA
ncbi:hypothetical protein EI42_05303 [Thermosporothrix hazakensis]|jgi:hypothetical protein|uniref:Uncharacterized protein n=1 Tax=Thermosporothrix hazakensis TaxID=644383 RepID=A0A326U0B4_THEHA|nr:hypothetical protein [Thermosporothrix hazakensis]PZW22852.1 hypothetical protein EI42_05303 [Thermosporothrix hazakensis]GCE49819.1 hypothetical protein KTH_46880 [Thermosporothrix hazakensis]